MASTRPPHFGAVLAFTLLATAACAARLSSAAAPAPDEADPYVVYVAQAEAHTRCGPSGEHYRTDPLRHGQKLEVYVETPDGWLGVRPPDDSFSWVIADAVEVGRSGDTGTILEDRTVSWIGTHLGRARRYQWQVQLAEGEPVTILGKSEREGPDGPQLWYRVVPPSGEFRWIHRDQIVETAEELVRSTRLAESDSGEHAGSIEFLPGRRPRLSDLARRERSEPLIPAPPTRRTEEDFTDKDFQSSDSRAAPRPGGARQASVDEPRVIGSGLREGWDSERAASDRTPPRDLHSIAEFISRPRIADIGDVEAPSASAAADDGNWVSGSSRIASTDSSSIPGSFAPRDGSFAPREGGDPNIRAVSNLQSPGRGVMTAHELSAGGKSRGLRHGDAPSLRPLRTVSSQKIESIEAETRGASVERLQLLFSRLVAEGASSVEVEPIRRAADAIATDDGDRVNSGRATLLVERVDQYRRIAQRRDGELIVRASATPMLPIGPTPASTVTAESDGQRSDQVGSMAAASAVPASLSVAANETRRPPGASPANGEAAGQQDHPSETGTLMAVYSVRRQSPPFVLVDRQGQTLAYVTPSPGVDLRRHLNSRVEVRGRRELLEGINTPHLIASDVARTPQR